MSTVAEPCSCTPRDRNSPAIACEPNTQASPSASGTAGPLNLNMEHSPGVRTLTERARRRGGAATSAAQSLDLQVVCIGSKASGLDALRQQSSDGWIAELRHRTAGA